MYKLNNKFLNNLYFMLKPDEDDAGGTDGQDDDELDDDEIAKLANKEIKARDAEIAKLKKELAKSKLYSKVDEDDEKPITEEEVIKILSNPNVSNYDYAQAVVDLCDIRESNGEPNPLGDDEDSHGEDVYNLFKQVLEECDGDKTKFTAIYQSRLLPDDKKVVKVNR